MFVAFDCLSTSIFPFPTIPWVTRHGIHDPETIRLQRTSEAQTAAIEPHDEGGEPVGHPKNAKLKTEVPGNIFPKHGT